MVSLLDFINSVSQTDEFKMLALEQSAKSDLLAPGGGSSDWSDPLACPLILRARVHGSDTFVMLTISFRILADVQSAEGHAARRGDPVDVIRRRIDQLEVNIRQLAKKVDETLEKFKNVEKQRMRRQHGLNQLIRTIAEVCDS